MPANQQNNKGRILNINIFRHCSQIKEGKGKIATYQVREEYGMTIAKALQEIRAKQDSSLLFDVICRQGECGSCAMLINHKPKLACKTLTVTLNSHINLEPLPGFDIIGDLSVDTNQAMTEMNIVMETWIHSQFKENQNFDQLEAIVDPDIINNISKLDSCIECGCCISACGTKKINPDFVGPLAIKKITRYLIDPRDKRSKTSYYKLIARENGISACLTLLACEDICPKHLPLNNYMSLLRRKMLRYIRKKKS